MKKKIIAVLLTGFMTVSAAACGSGNSDTSAAQEDTLISETQESTTADIGAADGDMEAAGESTTDTTGAAENVAESASENNDAASSDGGKILVLYFDYSENMGDISDMDYDAITSASLVGEHFDGVETNNILFIRDVIAERTGADAFSIRVTEPYDPSYNDMVNVAREDTNNDKRFDFVEDIDLSGYSTIFIGTPIWWNKLPQPVKVFVDEHSFSGKNLILYGIHRGSRFGQMVEQLNELTDAASVEGGYTTVATASNDTVRNEVTEWLESIGY